MKPNKYLFIFILIFELTFNQNLCYAEKEHMINIDKLTVTLKMAEGMTIKKIVDEVRKQIGNYVFLDRNLAAASDLKIIVDIDNLELKKAMLTIAKAYNQKVLILNSISSTNQNLYLNLYKDIHKEPNENIDCYILGYSKFQKFPTKYLKLNHISCEKIEKIIIDKTKNTLVAIDKSKNSIAYIIDSNAETIYNIIEKYDVELLSTTENLLKSIK